LETEQLFSLSAHLYPIPVMAKSGILF